MSGRALTIDITTRDQQTLAALKRIQRELGQLDKSIDTTAQNSDKLSKSAEEYGRKLEQARERAGQITLGGTVVALGLATKAASSLTEAQGKAKSVFAESYVEVKRFAEGAAQSLGQSERQVLDSAGTYGNLLQAMGLTTEQAKEMSIEMVKLGTDLAAFNDVPVDQAITALRSGLSGETEPLKQFGINLNDARLKQEALNLGLYNGKGQLDSNAKAQAAYSLIMKDSVLAQGTFARESDSAAGSQRRAAAEIENGAASMGEALLPVYAKGMELVGGLAGAFQKLPGPAQTAAVGVGGITIATALLAPKLIETARLMQFGGRAAVQWAQNLIVPKSAIDGLGSSSTSAQGRVAGLQRGVGSLSAGSVAGGLAVVGLGAAVTMYQQKAERAQQRTAELESGILALADAAESSGRSIDDVFASDTLPRWFAENADLADRFGLKADEMWAAIAEGEDATRAYAESLGLSGEEGLELISKLDLLQRQFAGSKEAAAASSAAQGDLASTTDDAAQSTADMEAAQKRAAAAIDENRQAAERARSAADAYRQAEDRVSSAQDAVVSARARVVTAERSVADARRGVEQASKAVADAEKGLASARAGAEDAARDLADAERELRDGSEELHRAQKQVADAERDLTLAQRDALVAQEDLTAARERAAERLEDLSMSARRAVLDERDAILSLEEARAALAAGPKLQEAKANETPEQAAERAKRNAEAVREHAEQRERLQLRVERAELALEEAKRRNEDASEALLDAEERGIEQSDEVVAAKDKITAADEKVTSAEERLVEAHAEVASAQEQMAARVVEAQARVTEANDRVTEAAERVREAIGGVREAQQRVVDQRASVVEARGAVAEAERDVTQALVDQAIAHQELTEALGKSQGALDEQIVHLLDLAGQMDPGSPVRRRLLEMAEELNALTARPWTIELQTALVAVEGARGAAQELVDRIEAATGGKGGKTAGRAVGGAVGPGWKGVVGEDGKEFLELGPTTQGVVRTPEQEAAEQRRAAAFAERESRRAGRFGATKGEMTARDVTLTFQITEAHSARETADATAARVLEVLDLEVAH